NRPAEAEPDERTGAEAGKKGSAKIHLPKLQSRIPKSVKILRRVWQADEGGPGMRSPGQGGAGNSACSRLFSRLCEARIRPEEPAEKTAAAMIGCPTRVNGNLRAAQR